MGDQVRLYGTVVTARDAAHKYMKDTFFQGATIPEADQVIHDELTRLWQGGVMYHCGPVVRRDDAGTGASSPPVRRRAREKNPTRPT